MRNVENYKHFRCILRIKQKVQSSSHTYICYIAFDYIEGKKEQGGFFQGSSLCSCAQKSQRVPTVLSEQSVANAKIPSKHTARVSRNTLRCRFCVLYYSSCYMLQSCGGATCLKTQSIYILLFLYILLLKLGALCSSIF